MSSLCPAYVQLMSKSGHKLEVGMLLFKLEQSKYREETGLKS